MTAFAKQLQRAGRTTAPVSLLAATGARSGILLQRIVVASLEASGCDCLIADVAATPTIGVLVRDQTADGAVQITASHNPPHTTVSNCSVPEGRVIGTAAGAAIRTAYERGDACWCGADDLGAADVIADPHHPHLLAVLATVDAAKIAEGFRVLLDSNHGAGAALGTQLLAALGCEVVLVGGDPDGQFEHVPEPTAENLQTIAAKVASERCDVGFCQDPDADRLALIDASGRYVGEEYTLALCIRACGPQSTTDTRTDRDQRRHQRDERTSSRSGRRGSLSQRRRRGQRGRHDARQAGGSMAVRETAAPSIPVSATFATVSSVWRRCWR